VRDVLTNAALLPLCGVAAGRLSGSRSMLEVWFWTLLIVGLYPYLIYPWLLPCWAASSIAPCA
jgi:hypothetical protein